MSAPDLEATETPRGAQAKRIMAAYDQLEVARTQATIDEDGQTLSMLRVTMDTLHSYARFMVDVQHDPALKS